MLGTDTGIGKTVVAALLLRALQRAGQAAVYLKPVQTGTEDDTQRVRELIGAQAGDTPGPLLRLDLPASVDQAAQAQGVQVRVAPLAEQIRQAQRQRPQAYWCLEAAGGLLVPFSSSEDQADLVRATGHSALLVARSGLGTLNHTRLTLEALHARGIDLKAIVLVGERHLANEASLAAWSAATPILHLPWLERLTVADLDAWPQAPRLVQVLA